MARDRDERIRTFDQAVTDLLTEPGGEGRWRVSMNLLTDTVETEEPPRPELRSFLVAAREFDASTADTYLPTILDDLGAIVAAEEARSMLGMLRERYEAARISLGVELEDAEGPITPRDAFGLLAYAYHLHRDAAKQARLAAMHPSFRELVRREGAAYADQIALIAILARSIGRDDPASTSLFDPAPPGTPTAAEYLARLDDPRISADP